MEEAKWLISELNSMLAEGEFHLSKRASNHQSLSNSNTNNEPSNTMKLITVLGLNWNPNNDEFHC